MGKISKNKLLIFLIYIFKYITSKEEKSKNIEKIIEIKMQLVLGVREGALGDESQF